MSSARLPVWSLPSAELSLSYNQGAAAAAAAAAAQPILFTADQSGMLRSWDSEQCKPLKHWDFPKERFLHVTCARGSLWIGTAATLQIRSATDPSELTKEIQQPSLVKTADVTPPLPESTEDDEDDDPHRVLSFHMLAPVPALILFFACYISVSPVVLCLG
jgi:hypothetical protein